MVHETNISSRSAKHVLKHQFKVCQVAHASLAYLDKHSTLDPVIVSVVSSIPTGGNPFDKIF